MKPSQILVIDDEPDLRTLYELTLLRSGYLVEVAGDLEQAWELLELKRFDVAIVDMQLPDGLGLSLIQKLKAQQRPERCIVITAHGSAHNAVESLKAGAFDYLSKPVDLQQFRIVIASAIQDASHRSDEKPISSNATAANIHQGAVALQRMVGQSTAMRDARERIAKVACSMAPVLVRGESGTGKELAARALHANSPRYAGPMVAVNCSAIPENLLESEFFGVRKGAYTGASHDRDGFFQAARGGTLFLDEIGDLPLAMQSKLLRAIQERCIRPVGANQEEAVDVRIISATHKDLDAEVQAGNFRQDLYYRINVIDIVMPALRERREDLPDLCRTLLQKIAKESGVPTPEVSDAFLAQLNHKKLLGNVRELENLLHRALALSAEGELTLETLLQQEQPTLTALAQDASEQPAESIPRDLQGHLDQQEREFLIRALQSTGFNRTAAANLLGISLRQMRYRISRLGIDAADESLDDKD